jgi:hypothetical protein
MAFLACVITIIGSVAMADDGMSKSSESKSPVKLTSEQRQRMAGLHEKMASCLRSDRPMAECRQEMMKGCKDTMGKDGCPMMGGKMGHGMHQHMMDEPGAAKD